MSQPSAFPDAPTEDRRILDELEQLQQAIRTSRVTRERAEAAFSGELRALETRVPPPSAEPAAPARTGPAESAPPAEYVPNRDPLHQLDTSKIISLGWKPQTHLRDGFRRTLDSYR